MQIVGYCVHGSKQYVAFRDEKERQGRFKITDGFHDRPVNERNAGKYEDYEWVDRQEIDLKKIISRMRGTRPWHPLLELLRKESAA